MKNRKRLIRPQPKTLIFLLLLTLMIFGCVKTGVLDKGSQLDGYIFVRNAVGNLRFELVQAPGETIIHPSENLRIKLGEQFRIKWDKFYGYWQKSDAMCTFDESSVSTESCRICQDCNPTAEERPEHPCSHFFYSSGDESVLIAEYKDFLTEDSNQKFVIRAPTIAWLCPTNLSYAPEFDATYRLLSAEGFYGETKVFTYSGAPRSVQYQLSKRVIDGTTFWSWTVGGDLKWIENYSKSLRVTNIRVFQAACGVDTNSNECTVPMDAIPVKPSRVLFVPNLGSTLDGVSEKDLRCYSNPQRNEDTKAFINLPKCLPEYGSTAPTEKFLTPTYFHDQENDKVTWLVEFNTNEGGDDMTNASNLIIQFDIEGV